MLTVREDKSEQTKIAVERQKSEYREIPNLNDIKL